MLRAHRCIFAAAQRGRPFEQVVVVREGAGAGVRAHHDTHQLLLQPTHAQDRSAEERLIRLRVRGALLSSVFPLTKRERGERARARFCDLSVSANSRKKKTLLVFRELNEERSRNKTLVVLFVVHET